MNIEFQQGSIVSKVLLKKQGGSVTLFAFDAGQELSEHTAPFGAVVHVQEGEMDISLSGNVHKLAAGDTLLMPANVPHALKAVRPTKMLLIMIRENA